MSGALSGGSDTNYRLAYQVAGYAYISRKIIVFQARVNMASISFPVTSITFDGTSFGSYTDIRVGYTLLLGSAAGLSDRGMQRVRATPTSTVIPVGRCSKGNRQGELNLADNLFITVIKECRPWAKIPWIDPVTGTQLKDQMVFSAATAQGPVANAGPDIIDFVDPGTNLLTVVFDGSNSFAVASGATITGYLWNADGGTVTAGSVSTSTFTATFVAGEYYIPLQVTDSNGNFHTALRYVVAVEKTGTYTPIEVEVATQQQTPEGQTLSLLVRSQAVPNTTYLPGTRVAYWQREIYGSTVGSLTGPTGVKQVKFTGWLATEPTQISADATGLHTQVTFQCVDMAGALKQLPGFGQRIERASSPVDWYQMANANIDRYAHYLLFYHSNACEISDVFLSGLGASYPIASLGSDGDTLYGQFDRIAQAIAHKLTCNANGQLKMKPDPQIMPTADQVAAYGLPLARTTVALTTLTADDYGEMTYDDAIPPRVHWDWGEAVVGSTTTKDTTSVFCVAPGHAPGQGASEVTQGEQLVFPTHPQQELNCREGHRYAARLNQAQGVFELRLTNPGWIWEPADMEWVKVTLPAAIAAQRGFTLSAQNALALDVTHVYDHRAGTKTVTARVELEVQGTEAETHENKANLTDTNTGYTPPEIIVPILPVPSGPDIYALKGIGTVATFWNDNTLRRTSNWTAIVPNYDNVSLASLTNWGGGTLIDFTVDAFSPLYLGTGSAVNGWICTTTQVQRITDIFGSPALGTSHTLVGGTVTSRQMQFERGAQNWGIVASYVAGTGTRISYTTDGTIWTDVSVSGSNRDTTLVNTWGGPGLWLDPHLAGHAIVTAFTNVSTFGSATTDGFETFDYGASWNPISNPNILPGNAVSTAIAASYADASGKPIYFGQRTFGPTYYQLYLYRATGSGSPVDITPTLGGITYGVSGPRSVVLSDDDPNTLLISSTAHDTSGSGLSPIAITRNAKATSPTWTQLTLPSGAVYNRGYISGTSTLYFVGGTIGWSTDGGTTIYDRTGDIISGGAVAVGLCGGR